MRAVGRGAEFAAARENRDEVVAMLAAPRRIDVPKSAVRAALDGHLKVSPDGATRKNAALSYHRRRSGKPSRSGAGRLDLRPDGALGPGPARLRNLPPPRARSTARISMMPRSGLRPARDAAAVTASAPSPARSSTPAMSAATSRPGRSDATADALPLLLRCTKYSQCCEWPEHFAAACRVARSTTAWRGTDFLHGRVGTRLE